MHHIILYFLYHSGDGIGHGSPIATGIGTNADFRFQHFDTIIYYYVKQEPVTVTPEVEKQIGKGRTLVDGEFSF